MDKKQAQLKRQLASRRWRLNNLYWIVNKDGEPELFRLNWAQDQLLKELHTCNIILKARQLGFSTFILLLILDACLFNSHTEAGLIDVTLIDATAKLAKVRFAYDRLPKAIRKERPLVFSNQRELRWKNGSGIRAGISHRGGTLQWLHVSEFGKICAKFPERAREVITGALNTLKTGNAAFIESTAEGEEGRFYEMCMASQEAKRRGDRLTALDFKFHFYPWWREPGYAIDADAAVIPEPLQRYFAKLAGQGVHLSPEQKAWYVKKRDTQQDDMKREYPATPAEAFEASVEGSILGPFLEAAELDGRIGDFKAFPGVPVHTFWDLGRADYTTIWFVQVVVGLARVVGFYKSCFTGMPHYAEYCYGTAHAQTVFPDFKPQGAATPGIFSARGWARGTDYFPHDGRVTEWGSDRSRLEQLRAAGFNPVIGTEMSLQDGINACRASIGVCQFDLEGCKEGLRDLRLYRWTWDDARGRFDTAVPHKNDAIHTADGFRTFATTWRDIVPVLPTQPRPVHQVFIAEEGGRQIVSNMSPYDRIMQKQRARERDRAG